MKITDTRSMQADVSRAHRPAGRHADETILVPTEWIRRLSNDVAASRLQDRACKMFMGGKDFPELPSADRYYMYRIADGFCWVRRRGWTALLGARKGAPPSSSASAALRTPHRYSISPRLLWCVCELEIAGRQDSRSVGLKQPAKG